MRHPDALKSIRGARGRVVVAHGAHLVAENECERRSSCWAPQCDAERAANGEALSAIRDPGPKAPGTRTSSRARAVEGHARWWNAGSPNAISGSWSATIEALCVDVG